MTHAPASAAASAPDGPASASARVLREVIRGLHEGDYVPGQRLAEPELMQRFGVSRSTARESIRRMEAEGIVDFLAHRGAVIRRLTPGEALDALLVLEFSIGLAARQAAERIDRPGSREAVAAAWENLRAFRSHGEGYEIIKARNRFYRAITRASGNRELQRIVPAIHVHLLRREYSRAPDTRFDDYEKIASAILAGNAPLAESAAREHMARTADLVRAHGNAHRRDAPVGKAGQGAA